MQGYSDHRGHYCKLPLHDSRPAREVPLIAAGVVAVVSIVELATLPQETWRSWCTAAEGTGEPTFVQQLTYFLLALHENAIAWHIVSLMITGSVAGMLARRAVPGDYSGGAIGAGLLGILGAVFGGWVCQMCGYPLESGVSLLSIGVAFAGSVIVLIGYRLLVHL